MDTDNLNELQVFARTLDGEAANQGYDGQCAVANVIMKRVALKWKGDTDARSVCLHHMQFSCWNGTNDSNPDRKRIMDPQEETTATYNQCAGIAGLAIAGELPDLTNGADSYEVTYSGAYWAAGLTPSAVIGKHSFYVTV